MGNTTSSEQANISQQEPPPQAQHAQQRRVSERPRSRLFQPTRSRTTASSRPFTVDIHRHINSPQSESSISLASRSLPIQTHEGQEVSTNQVVIEREESSTVDMEDLGESHTPITRISATPLSRRASTMSRFGSRFLPHSVVRGLQMSGEETPAEGHAHRTGMQGSITRATERRMSGNNGGRFSWRQRLRNQPARFPPRRPAGRASHSADFSYPDVLQSSESVADFNTLPLPQRALSGEPEGEGSWRRRARVARNSLSFPLGQMFNRSPDRSTVTLPSTGSLSQPLRSHATNSNHFLPPLSTMDHSLGFDNSPHNLSRRASETGSGNMLTPSASTSSNNTSPSALRRFPHGLRSRGRIARNGPPGQPPLAQVLHLAASAIAAQLSGHAGSTISNMQPLASNGFDGTIQSFVQTLQQAAAAQARSNNENGNSEAGEEEGLLPPVNFLRVFSFPNSDSGNSTNSASNGGTSSQSHASDRMEVDQQSTDDRSVTLVLVGIRSMPHGEVGSGEDGATTNPSLDALLNLPFFPPSNLLQNGNTGALLRRADNRARMSNRRNSMTNFSSFPQQYDSQRHHRTRSSTNRSTTDGMPIVTPQSTLPSVLSESPPGPVPPPSTPAEPFLSGQSTPNRRPSSASAMHLPNLPDLSEDSAASSSNVPEGHPADASHYRRRSDSEFARRPELSSGATRRNGMVEPDTNGGTTGGRSWLIYVVGANVSPDHPAFTMPSLFTDNPSYEDMQLLSSMLGPVKPPVATQADVASSGGLYRLVVNGPTLVAEPDSEGLAPITLHVGERCLICLCDYEAAEELRELTKCKHLYHRECVDEWLTTGRNSCPLCRGQGVNEGSNRSSNTNEPTSATPQSAGA